SYLRPHFSDCALVVRVRRRGAAWIFFGPGDWNFDWDLLVDRRCRSDARRLPAMAGQAGRPVGGPTHVLSPGQVAGKGESEGGGGRIANRRFSAPASLELEQLLLLDRPSDSPKGLGLVRAGRVGGRKCRTRGAGVYFDSSFQSNRPLIQPSFSQPQRIRDGWRFVGAKN